MKNDEEEQFDLIAKTLYGLEDVLAEELTALNAEDVTIGRRMVSFRGDKELMYRANFRCRTALRILKPIAYFTADNADSLYEEVRKIDWDKYFTADNTFAIDAVIYSETFTHSKFVAYKAKDAIVDFFNDKYDKRPSVRINNPDMYIHIHISHNDCTIALDSSGESLHKRGYRTSGGEAPLNEVLAAGMILKTGWRGESNFVDPMCGSGTLLIEAAMIALNVAPGIYRDSFAFEKWNDFDSDLFSAISEEDVEERDFAYKCYGSDSSPEAIKTALKNVKNAGLTNFIELQALHFQQYTEAPQPGILVTNPPYGERIPVDDLMGLYAMLGERLKHVFMGYNAWILSFKDECFEKIGLRPSQKIKLMNGQLECGFNCYELFEGKNKEYKKALHERKPFERKDFTSERTRPTFERSERRERFTKPAKPQNYYERKQALLKQMNEPFVIGEPPAAQEKPAVEQRDFRKPFANKRFSDRKPFENRRFGDKKPYESKRYDDRKPFDSKRFSDRKPFDARKRTDDKKRFDDRKRFDGDRRFAKDKPFYAKDKPYGKKSFDKNKPFRKDKPFRKPTGTKRYTRFDRNGD